MVETIAPVVYGRRARYLLAVFVHAVAAALAGGSFGALLGLVGLLLQGPWGTAGLVLVASVALLYAARELAGLPVPIFDRRQQVPDWWRTFFSPEVAAALYGAGLGIGFLTFLSFGTYVAVCVAAVASGDPLVGAAFGATFGAARGLSALASSRANDEEAAGQVVVRLESIAVGRGPRLVNGLTCLVLAIVAIASM